MTLIRFCLVPVVKYHYQLAAIASQLTGSKSDKQTRHNNIRKRVIAFLLFFLHVSK